MRYTHETVGITVIVPLSLTDAMTETESERQSQSFTHNQALNQLPTNCHQLIVVLYEPIFVLTHLHRSEATYSKGCTGTIFYNKLVANLASSLGHTRYSPPCLQKWREYGLIFRTVNSAAESSQVIHQVLN